jgi:hypothetical protein
MTVSWIENPRVRGSIPRLATKNASASQQWGAFSFVGSRVALFPAVLIFQRKVLELHEKLQKLPFCCENLASQKMPKSL